MTPKIRESLYYVGTIVPAIIGLALIWGGIDQASADSIGDIIAGVVSLLGAGAPATAAAKVRQQRKDGTFDTPSPAEAVVKGVEAVVAAQQTAQAEFDRVTQVLTSAANVVPNLGPLASQILNTFEYRP